MAAFQGDFIFQAPRRFFLETASKTQTAFAFRMFPIPLIILLVTFGWPFFFLVYKRGKTIPDFGAFHASDIVEFYGYVVNNTTPDFIGTDALGMFSSPVIISVLRMTYRSH